jgi:hypothetical protein
MSGIQEILLILGLVLGVIFIPRMMPKRPEARRQSVTPPFKYSGRLRAALVASAIYPAIVAAWFQPWQKDLAMFCYIGIGPVVVSWLVVWVVAGFKKKSRR